MIALIIVVIISLILVAYAYISYSNKNIRSLALYIGKRMLLVSLATICFVVVAKIQVHDRFYELCQESVVISEIIARDVQRQTMSDRTMRRVASYNESVRKTKQFKYLAKDIDWNILEYIYYDIDTFRQ